MIVIVGSVVWLVAVVVGFTGPTQAAPLRDLRRPIPKLGLIVLAARARAAVAAPAKRTSNACLRPPSAGRELRRTRSREMSFGREVAHKAEAAVGSMKKAFGRATGNTRLRVEGRAGQFKGNTKQAGDKLKDAFKH